MGGSLSAALPRHTERRGMTSDLVRSFGWLSRLIWEGRGAAETFAAASEDRHEKCG